MSSPVSPALKALLTQLIDYAGSFPPAGLDIWTVVDNYVKYQKSDHAWMLRWLVLGQADTPQGHSFLDGQMSVLCDIDFPRAACIESKTIFKATRPVYAEVPVTELARVKEAGCFAKIRTGSVKPEGIPSVEDVARFILTCAELKLAFKATAGLHHPIRAEYPLTYETNAPRAVMHGFLNVFLAACFAWHGERQIVPILSETDPNAFRFDEQAHWRNHSLTAPQIQEARKAFAHAFGSCSFAEPIQDLQARGWL